jgi:hypothetical protein
MLNTMHMQCYFYGCYNTSVITSIRFLPYIHTVSYHNFITGEANTVFLEFVICWEWHPFYMLARYGLVVYLAVSLTHCQSSSRMPLVVVHHTGRWKAWHSLTVFLHERHYDTRGGEGRRRSHPDASRSHSPLHTWVHATGELLFASPLQITWKT